MSKKKIANPKVFISYAWGNKAYEEKVLSFATKLMGDGIDVVIDKWNLSEGNDTYAFMEQCATNSSITNVLMLIDPVYVEKADKHTGGVGTETQIISQEVYQSVDQSKFIPVIFERKENGELCKPTYLGGRLHIDLSIADQFDSQYSSLVKILYGEEVYPKPELGKKPAWVDKTTSIEIKKISSFDAIKTVFPEKAKQMLFSKYISEQLGNIKKCIDLKESVGDTEEVLNFYNRFGETRTEYLALLEYSMYIDSPEKIIAKELEKCALKIQEDSSVAGGLSKNFLHELFLYSIAYFLKNDDYNSAGYILGRTYYNPITEKKISSYDLFYSGRYDSLDRAMNERNDKKYVSGCAEYWIENIEAKYYTKEQFVLADLVCYNYSVYGKDNLMDWYWFPLTYIYDNEYSSVLDSIARKFVSREFLEQILPLFGYRDIESIKNRLMEVDKEIKNGKYSGKYRNIRYPEYWHSAPLINQYLDLDKMASVR